MARGTNGGSGGPEAGDQTGGGQAEGVQAVGELTYSAAGHELDRIIEEFEAGVIDVDRLVERLQRATEIVDELDRRLRRTRMQVEELVPRLEAIGRPELAGSTTVDDDDADDWGPDGDEDAQDWTPDSDDGHPDSDQGDGEGAAIDPSHKDGSPGASSSPGLF